MKSSSLTYLTQVKYDAYQKQLIFMEREGVAKLSTLLAAAPGSGMGRPLDLPIHDTARQFYNEIDELKTKLKNAVIIDDYVGRIQYKDKIDIGAKVTLVDATTNSIEKYYILGSDEADPPLGRISYLSPLGKALLGKKNGDVVTLATGFKARVETIAYETLAFEYSPKDWETILNNVLI